MGTTITLNIKTVLLFILVNLSFKVSSQEYLRGFGFRIGGYAAYQALTYKEFLSPQISLETILGKNTGKDSRNISLQTNFQYNINTRNFKQITFYGGLGPKFIYWFEGSDLAERSDFYTKNNPKYRLAINSLIGVEAKIGNLPLSTALDFGPSFFVYPYTKMDLMLNASVFYTIKNRRFTAHSHLSKKAYSKRGRRF